MKRKLSGKRYLRNEYSEDSYGKNEKLPSYVRKKVEYEFKKVINYILTAKKILKEGKSLCRLNWIGFRYLIAELLERRGLIILENKIWKNESGGITTVGEVEGNGFCKVIWITRKYSPDRLVGVDAVRLLEYIVAKKGAAMGVLVTTSTLTKDALKLIRKSPLTLSYIDNIELEIEIKSIRE